MRWDNTLVFWSQGVSFISFKSNPIGQSLDKSESAQGEMMDQSEDSKSENEMEIKENGGIRILVPKTS